MAWLPTGNRDTLVRAISRALSWLIPIVRCPVTEDRRYGYGRNTNRPDAPSQASRPPQRVSPSSTDLETTLIVAHLTGRTLPRNAVTDLARIPSAVARFMCHGVAHPAVRPTVQAVPWGAGDILVARYTHDLLVASAASHPAVAARARQQSCANQSAPMPRGERKGHLAMTKPTTQSRPSSQGTNMAPMLCMRFPC